MAFITALVDVQDQSGASIVQPNPDGTRSPLVLKMGPGVAAAFVKSGDQGIITLTVAGGSMAAPTITNTSKTLSANNTTAKVPLFAVTGQVRVKLWGIVTTPIGSNLTAEKFIVDDGTSPVDITISAGVPAMSSLPAGSIIVGGAEGTPADVVSAATGTINSNAGGSIFQEYLIGKKSTAATSISFQYTTTSAPLTGVVQFFCEWFAVSADGAIAAL